jgi:competence protein ComEA
MQNPPPASSSRRSDGATVVLAIGFTLMGWTFHLTASARVPPPPAGHVAARATEVRTRINPNTAPWWELTALPRIGEVTARAIVAHRKAAATAPSATPAFTRAEDLAAVRGIGPKTVARIAPHLRFD